jgi:hypothetical protein
MKLSLAALGMLSLCALTPAALAAAQEGNLAQIFFQKVKPGSQAEYAAGRQRHMDWHKAKGDSWAWFAWEIVTGENTGTYAVGSFGHSFKDFDGRDEFEAADAGDAAKNLAPFVESTTQSLYLHRADMSAPMDAAAPTKYSQIIHFQVKPESVNDFVDSVKKLGEAAKKTNVPARPEWYQLWSGGMGPEFVLALGANTWAELQPGRSLDAIAEDAYGKSAGAALVASFRRTVRYTYSELIAYHPELSYVPSAQ